MLLVPNVYIVYIPWIYIVVSENSIIVPKATISFYLFFKYQVASVTPKPWYQGTISLALVNPDLVFSTTIVQGVRHPCSLAWRRESELGKIGNAALIGRERIVNTLSYLYQEDDDDQNSYSRISHCYNNRYRNGVVEIILTNRKHSGAKHWRFRPSSDWISL